MGLKILLWKNFKVLSRNYFLVLIAVFSPLIIFAMMLSLKYLSEYYIKANEILSPDLFNLNSSTGLSKMKIGFTHGTTDWSDHIISYISSQQPSMKIHSFPNLNQSEFLIESKANDNNKISILFCTDYIEIGTEQYDCLLPNATNGSLIYNIIYSYKYPSEVTSEENLQKEVLTVKYLIDKAILKFWSPDNPEIDINIQPFPIRDRYFTNYNVLAGSGSTYFIITSFLISSLILLEVTREKSDFIKIYLHLNSVSQWKYWLSWLIISVIISLFCAIFAPILGIFLGFEEFSKIPLGLMIGLFFLMHLCGAMMGALMASMINEEKHAYTASLTMIMLGFVIQAIGCNPLMIKYLSFVDSSWWVLVVKYCFYAYPPYNFSVIFYQLISTAGLHFDSTENMWVLGRDVLWSDILNEDSGFLGDYEYKVPACILNYAFLLGFLLVSVLLLCYLELVFPGNRAKKL